MAQTCTIEEIKGFALKVYIFMYLSLWTRENLSSGFTNNTCVDQPAACSAPLLFANKKVLYLSLLQRSCNALDSLCSSAGWFKDDQIGENKFSRDETHPKTNEPRHVIFNSVAF